MKTYELPPTFGERLKAERARQGKTLAQVAADAGIKLFSVWRIEAGRQAPSVYLAARLARALGMPLDRLLSEGEK